MMSEAKQWRYYTAACRFKETKEAGFFGGSAEGYWVLELDREYPLTEGLNLMGSRGYELAGIQPTDLRNGGEMEGRYHPSFYYVFKQPADA